MVKRKEALSISAEFLQDRIYHIRGHQVILDADLAELYDVETKALKQAVRRNIEIFPAHFMFELTRSEFDALRSQTVTSNFGRGGARYLPMVFTEHGVLQAAGILRSQRAKQMSISIIEVFVKMRELITSQQELYKQLDELRKSVTGHDEQIQLIFKFLQEFRKEKQIEHDQAARRKIGYERRNK